MLDIEVEELNKLISLIDRIIAANCTVESFNALQTQTHINNSNLKLEDGLLLYQNRLIVSNTNNLHTDLIREAYN